MTGFGHPSTVADRGSITPLTARRERYEGRTASWPQEIMRIAAQPDMREKFTQLGLDTVSGSSTELAAIIKSDIVKWAKVIKDAGVKGDE